MRRLVLPVAIVCCLLATAARAATLIHAGRLIDGRNREPQSEMTIVVEDGRIASVVPGFTMPQASDKLIDLREYTDGKYPQLLNEARKAVAMAEISLKNKQEELAQSRNLYAKGFSTAADVKKSELDVLTAQNDVEKKHNELKVLQEYTYEKEVTDKKNKLVQAERKLQQTKTENAANLAQKVADVVMAPRTTPRTVAPPIARIDSSIDAPRHRSAT